MNTRIKQKVVVPSDQVARDDSNDIHGCNSKGNISKTSLDFVFIDESEDSNDSDDDRLDQDGNEGKDPPRAARLQASTCKEPTQFYQNRHDMAESGGEDENDDEDDVRAKNLSALAGSIKAKRHEESHQKQNHNSVNPEEIQ